MNKKTQWLNQIIEFSIANAAIFATIATTAYVIIRQADSATKLSTDDLITAVVTVLGLLALSEFIERYRRLGKIESISQKILENVEVNLAKSPSALDFFSTRIDIEEKIRQSSGTAAIDLCGVTLTKTINKSLGSIRLKIQEGGKLRIMLADPESLALKMSDLRSEDPEIDYYSKRLETTLQDLKYLYKFQQEIGREALELRLLQYASSFSYAGFNTSDQDGVICVELYQQGFVGWDEPCFELTRNRDGQWFDYFAEQYEQMWHRAKKWEFPSEIGLGNS